MVTSNNLPHFGALIPWRDWFDRENRKARQHFAHHTYWLTTAVQGDSLDIKPLGKDGDVTQAEITFLYPEGSDAYEPSSNSKTCTARLLHTTTAADETNELYLKNKQDPSQTIHVLQDITYPALIGGDHVVLGHQKFTATSAAGREKYTYSSRKSHNMLIGTYSKIMGQLLNP